MNSGFPLGNNVVDETNIVKRIESLLGDEKKMQRISSAGREMVLKKHTLLERGKSLIKCIDSIKKNAYKGSCWDAGNFCIIE